MQRYVIPEGLADRGQVPLFSLADPRETQQYVPFVAPMCWCGRPQDCLPAQERRVLGDGLPGNRTQQGNRTARPSQLAQKRLAQIWADRCRLSLPRVRLPEAEIGIHLLPVRWNLILNRAH